MVRIQRVLFLGILLSVGLAFAGESDVKKKLKRAIKGADRSMAKEAMSEAAALEGTKGSKLILKSALHLGLMGLVDEVVEALSQSKDMKEVAKAAKKHKVADVRYLAIRALGLKGDEESLKVCREALKDKAEVVAVSAVRESQKRPDKELVGTYISMLKSELKAKPKKQKLSLIRELVTALRNLTGKDDIEDIVDWENYWASHKEKWRAPDQETSGGKDDVIGRMKKHRKSDVKTLERLGKTDLVVVRGRSDRVEDVLKSLKLEHKQIRREEFTKFELNPNSVLILNCNGNKDLFSEEELRKISNFVAKGGYLFASDWQLKFTIEKAFPGVIGFGGETKRTKKGEEEKAPIQPVLPNHPYMRDVFPLSTLERAGYRWKLDGRSHLIKILNKKGVVPLIQAPSMSKTYRMPFVAVTFRWDGKVVTNNRVATGGKKALEGGAVLHVLGHFKNQKDGSDKFALQQLLLNFVLEKQREKRLKAK